jgi:hypothetical protein
MQKVKKKKEKSDLVENRKIFKQIKKINKRSEKNDNN